MFGMIDVHGKRISTMGIGRNSHIKKPARAVKNPLASKKTPAAPWWMFWHRAYKLHFVLNGFAVT